MAYFANGAEGEILDNQCEKCLYGMDDDILCPVSAVQTIYNYDQCDNDKLAEAMDMLVDAKGTCKMRQAMKQVGISFDTSYKQQMVLPLLAKGKIDLTEDTPSSFCVSGRNPKD